jgi:hypothetical protein
VTEYRFRTDFAAALGWAQLGKKLPHDMRRAMARDQTRAGVSKTVAMANAGHSDAATTSRHPGPAKALLATEAFRASAAKSDTPSDSQSASA